MQRTYIILSSIFFITASYAAPSEIIIVRHADKLPTAKGLDASDGPYLSAKGLLRSVKFANYYTKNFAIPDYIFAAKPAVKKIVNQSHSFRPYQTMMPIANKITLQTHHPFIIKTPYYQMEYNLLAKEILHNKKYDRKRILICWQHGKINFLTQDLGVKTKLEKWQEDNYDQVYVIKYDKNGKLTSFTALKNQYPITENITWESLSSQK